MGIVMFKRSLKSWEGCASQRGFTLMEMMIAVAIIGILAAVAIPSYQKYVQKTHRTDAQAALVEMAQTMERSYARTYTYKALAVGGADSGTPSAAILRDIKVEHYALTISAATANTYTLTATPKAGVQSSDRCGTMTINNAGTKTGAEADYW